MITKMNLKIPRNEISFKIKVHKPSLMVSGTSLLKTVNLVVITTCIYVHLAFPLQWLSSF